MFDTAYLEISDGSGFGAFDITEHLNVRPSTIPDIQQQSIDFEPREMSYPDENGNYKDTQSLTLEQLESIIDNPHYMRLRIVGGIREGVSNTAYIFNGQSLDKEPPIADGSEVLPSIGGDHGGNRGGITSFWQSGTGIGLAIVIGVVCAAICFGGGFLICILIYRKTKKNE